MKDVFISYSSQDQAAKDELIQLFDKEGITYWLDEIGLGKNIQDEINKGLRESHFTILLVSRNSLLSTWVSYESLMRLKQEIFENKVSFIPLILDRIAFEDDIVFQMKEKFDEELNRQEELRDKAKKRGIKTRPFNNKIDLLEEISHDVDKIIIKITGNLSINFIDKNRKPNEVEKLLNTIKPERLAKIIAEQKKAEEIKKQEEIEEKRIKEAENQRKIEENKKLEAEKQEEIEEKRIKEAENQRKIEEKPKIIDNKPKIIENIHQSYIEKVNGVEFKMIFVEGGTFTMGSDNGRDNQKPAHPVTLDSFYIAETQVTQELYEKVMGTNPSYFQNCPQCPVEKVNWQDAQDFIKKLTQLSGKKYGLLTEAQWEYAARGGNKSQNYKYAGSNNIDDVAWYWDNSEKKTHPVKTKKPNELGIYDMSGNVWEWCEDWYGDYPNSPQTNPQGAKNGLNRCLRGGSWDFNDDLAEVLNRVLNFPRNRNNNNGFRLLRTP
ncbi:MAG: SUMF1/EgtB/PvdO family nonheme iron enzyme [Microscillaceae bacterium]|jgi:formylglycine-generating enzyme required for sulfatase activity|nr:SUMF1/EgtB/PvdO family nonheme iron enzyme [Microscillaceae bacterium]